MVSLEMKNFSVITTVRLILLRHCRPESLHPKLSGIPEQGNSFEVIGGIKPHSSSFNETEKESEAGSYFEKKLKFEISKIRPEVSKQLEKYASSNQVAAIITDANGHSLLIYPLRRTIKRELPGTAKGANLTAVEFSGSAPTESPFVEIDL